MPGTLHGQAPRGSRGVTERMHRDPGGRRREEGVSSMIEYVLISGILMVMLVFMMFMVNAHIMEGPADTLSYAAFADIGNGISTRIVDVYVIAPRQGTITTMFDIPDEVASKDYFVEISVDEDSENYVVAVSRDYVRSTTSLAGIWATKGVYGNTTGRGMNRISYDSRGL